MDRRIAVWGLSERVERALRSSAARRSITLCAADGAASSIALVVRAPTTAPAHTEAERLAALYRGCPLILLARSQRDTQGFEGAHDIVPAAADSEATAARLLRTALDAEQEYALSLVGGSATMRALRAELRLAAPAPSTVLLLGETGTGKGVAARALHELSHRASDPFETVDCAGLAPSVIESELFGHERGSFTGAYERHIGKLERAARGTLFLDEIGELEVALQTRLLRALEERVFERVGGSAQLPVRARVVAATHRDLSADVATGRFRRDLLYRLDVLRIRLPALSERAEDIPSLVDHLLIRAAERLERAVPRAAPELIEDLRQRRWAGNVRELANLLEAMAVRSNSELLTAEALPAGAMADVARDVPLDERGQLAALLLECGGNVARVARRLGRPRSTVRSRISRLGLSRLLPRD